MKFRLIVNPRAGAGSAGRSARDVSRALQRLGIAHDVAETRAPGHATELARMARDDGMDLIGVVGGDGTLNEVSQAYLAEDGTAAGGPDLALIPFGTGGDFRRTFGITGLKDALDRIVRMPPRPIDLGVLELEGPSGNRIRKAFLNIASFGVGGQVDRIVNESPKWMGGRAAFLLGTVRALATYRNAPVRVLVDGALWFEGRIVNVAIANGRYFGGGMQVAPNADPGDGQFDIVAAGDLTVLENLGLSGRIYSGKHLTHPKVRATRGHLVEAFPLRADESVLVDLDGEQPGQLPIRATLLPGALRIRA